MFNDDREQKTKFAEAWLRDPDHPIDAARIVFNDLGIALQVGSTWVNDPFVLAEKARLFIELGPKNFLARKEDQAREIYKICLNDKLSTDDRLKAHRLYAEIMGHIEKPQTNIQNNLVTGNVLYVPAFQSQEEWERKAIEQQRSLTSDAISVN
jgi:hypothetical protein